MKRKTFKKCLPTERYKSAECKIKTVLSTKYSTPVENKIMAGKIFGTECIFDAKYFIELYKLLNTTKKRPVHWCLHEGLKRVNSITFDLSKTDKNRLQLSYLLEKLFLHISPVNELRFRCVNLFPELGTLIDAWVESRNNENATRISLT